MSGRALTGVTRGGSRRGPPTSCRRYGGPSSMAELVGCLQLRRTCGPAGTDQPICRMSYASRRDAGSTPADSTQTERQGVQVTMPIPIEPPRRPHSPRWAVVCWIAALHREHGRPDQAEMYLVELMGLAFEGWGVKA